MGSSDRQFDSLYEKIYFHEIDGRDKVAQRLQLPLVAFLATAGFVGSMLQSVSRTVESPPALAFWIVMGMAVSCLIGATGFFMASLIGRKYKYLPVPEAWAAHVDQCSALYADYKDSDKLVSAALTKNLIQSYRDCGTKNGEINAQKAFFVFMLLRFLVGAAFFTLVGFAIFYTARLDKNSVRMTHQVEILGPLTIKGRDMTNKEPPPPPPPPPAREIREDRPTPVVPPPPVKIGAQNAGR